METKSSKHVQVDKDKTRIFVTISVAALVTVASLVIARGYWSRGNYLSKVIGDQEMALQTLEQNQAAVDTLETAYESFESQNPNLLAGTPDGAGERDGDNATLVLDALPSKYDFPALASSLERMLAGRSITSISGADDSTNQAGVVGGGPVDMPFAFGIRTTYDSFKQLINDFNVSIRPFYFNTINLRGSNESLSVDASGKTFYQPEQGVQITESEVK
jgi:hypothetical protein